MGRLNVMHIRDSSGLYGAERVILALARKIDPKRFRFILLCLLDITESALPLIKQAKELGIHLEVVSVRNAWDIRSVQVIRKALLSHDVHILHTHDFKSTWFGMLSSINLSVTRVATVHGSIKDSLKIRASLFLEELIIRKCFDQVIVVAEDLQADLLRKGFRRERLRVIQNGIDLSIMGTNSVKTLGAGTRSRDEMVFGVVGRLVPDKGHRYFLQAFSRVAQEHPQVTALIVGGGPSEDVIRNEVEQLGLERRVLLCGARSDMANVYREIQCLVIPSLREGLPYVLLEALASKIPVIGSAVGDIPLLISHGKTGYLVSPANVNELYKYMILVMNNGSNAARLAEEGYRLVRERYSSDRMVKEVENLYEALEN